MKLEGVVYIVIIQTRRLYCRNDSDQVRSMVCTEPTLLSMSRLRWRRRVIFGPPFSRPPRIAQTPSPSPGVRRIDRFGVRVCGKCFGFVVGRHPWRALRASVGGGWMAAKRRLHTSATLSCLLLAYSLAVSLLFGHPNRRWALSLALACWSIESISRSARRIGVGCVGVSWYPLVQMDRDSCCVCGKKVRESSSRQDDEEDGGTREGAAARVVLL